MLVQNYRHQSETDRRVVELQRIISGTPATHPSSMPETTVSVVLDDGTSGSEFVRKQRNLDEILNVGWNLINERDPAQAAKAVEVFTEGIANLDSGSPELYNGLGRALLITGNPSGAIAAWRKGLELAPNFSDMESGIGWAYWSQNDPARAKDAWQKALRINPHSADAWSAMAWIDLALGNCAEAKSGFQELSKFDSKRQSWAIGLSMAQGNNADIREISAFFPLPPLKAFEQPLPVELVSTSTGAPIAPELKN
jgi:tetratricopeptide (TPR) repeat protein